MSKLGDDLRELAKCADDDIIKGVAFVGYGNLHFCLASTSDGDEKTEIRAMVFNLNKGVCREIGGPILGKAEVL